MLYIFVYIHTVQLVCVGGDCCATTTAVLSKSHSIYSIQGQVCLCRPTDHPGAPPVELECNLNVLQLHSWSATSRCPGFAYDCMKWCFPSTAQLLSVGSTEKLLQQTSAALVRQHLEVNKQPLIHDWSVTPEPLMMLIIALLERRGKVGLCRSERVCANDKVCYSPKTPSSTVTV